MGIASYGVPRPRASTSFHISPLEASSAHATASAGGSASEASEELELRGRCSA